MQALSYAYSYFLQNDILNFKFISYLFKSVNGINGGEKLFNIKLLALYLYCFHYYE